MHDTIRRTKGNNKLRAREKGDYLELTLQTAVRVCTTSRYDIPHDTAALLRGMPHGVPQCDTENCMPQNALT